MNHHATTDAPDDLDLKVPVVDLIGKPGSHREIDETFTVDGQQLGTLALVVPSGEQVHIHASLESVVEGIYIGGTVEAHLTGECSRCLDPVQQELDTRIDELFSYPEKVPADEEEDVAVLEGDTIDLGMLVRDAIAVGAEERPLCKPDCQGLCAQCGARLEDDPDHHHDVTDPRWAALGALLAQDDEPGDDDRPEPDGER